MKKPNVSGKEIYIFANIADVANNVFGIEPTFKKGDGLHPCELGHI